MSRRGREIFGDRKENKPQREKGIFHFRRLDFRLRERSFSEADRKKLTKKTLDLQFCKRFTAFFPSPYLQFCKCFLFLFLLARLVGFFGFAYILVHLVCHKHCIALI